MRLEWIDIFSFILRSSLNSRYNSAGVVDDVANSRQPWPKAILALDVLPDKLANILSVQHQR